MSREFYVDTPIGRLRISAKHLLKDFPNDYPGVYVDLVRDGMDDVILACVEYDSGNNEIQTCVYGVEGHEEPTDIVVFGDEYRNRCR